MQEVQFRKKNFDSVYQIMRELEGTDPQVIESLFYYKVNDQEQFEEEAKYITKEYKFGVLDPMREVSKYEQQMRYKKRKEVLKSIIKARVANI
mmetsp:Transcript_21426/g.20596  ORF Transcript_21426/g.20596 Transcript_21426/m.20596 type:complete len:93 (-) Transcript_21426:41-319(-)